MSWVVYCTFCVPSGVQDQGSSLVNSLVDYDQVSSSDEDDFSGGVPGNNGDLEDDLLESDAAAVSQDLPSSATGGDSAVSDLSAPAAPGGSSGRVPTASVPAAPGTSAPATPGSGGEQLHSTPLNTGALSLLAADVASPVDAPNNNTGIYFLI